MGHRLRALILGAALALLDGLALEKRPSQRSELHPLRLRRGRCPREKQQQHVGTILSLAQRTDMLRDCPTDVSCDPLQLLYADVASTTKATFMYLTRKTLQIQSCNVRRF